MLLTVAAAASATSPPPHDLIARVDEFIPLDFTYVLYTPSLPHSLPLAYLTFLPILIAFALMVQVLLRRDLEAVYHLTGLLLSTGINTVLKKIIAQKRPDGSAKLGHGMPSDHAQFSFFFVTYFSIFLLYRSRSFAAFNSERKRRGIILGMVILACVICFSRIHLGVHTPAQIFVGSLIGCALGFVWGSFARSWVWKVGYPMIERTTIARRFFFKDCSNLPAGVQSAQEFEYQCYMAQRGKTAGSENGNTKQNGRNGK